MITYALDTNIISYMLKKDPLVCRRFLKESEAGHECIIPPIVYYEIKRGLLAALATAKWRALTNYVIISKWGK
jgi:tRNA(fMet)-specific endonuclease VapC